ncbi:hypothetical protein ACQ4LE_009390 [Meloidogyne hapla]
MCTSPKKSAKTSTTIKSSDVFFKENGHGNSSKHFKVCFVFFGKQTQVFFAASSSSKIANSCSSNFFFCLLSTIVHCLSIILSVCTSVLVFLDFSFLQFIPCSQFTPTTSEGLQNFLASNQQCWDISDVEEVVFRQRCGVLRLLVVFVQLSMMVKDGSVQVYA